MLNIWICPRTPTMYLLLILSVVNVWKQCAGGVSSFEITLLILPVQLGGVLSNEFLMFLSFYWSHLFTWLTQSATFYHSVIWWPSGKHDKLISIDQENIFLWNLDCSRKVAQVNSSRTCMLIRYAIKNLWNHAFVLLLFGIMVLLFLDSLFLMANTKSCWARIIIRISFGWIQPYPSE